MPDQLEAPAFDDDNPEWTKEDFALATRFEPGIKASDLTPEMLSRVARRGPPRRSRETG